jgi:hypothetical protein
LQNSTPAAASAENGNVFRPAGGLVNLCANFVRITHDDKVFGRLPKPEDFAAVSAFRRFQQRFVAREVFCSAWKGEIQEFHSGGFAANLSGAG